MLKSVQDIIYFTDGLSFQGDSFKIVHSEKSYLLSSKRYL